MIKESNLKNHLGKTLCSKCGASLDTAKLVPINELPLAVIAHAVCTNCKSENMVTITSLGTGVVATASDLTGDEVRKFAHANRVTFGEVIALHKQLKKGSICNLLQKKENNLEKKQKR